MGYFRQYLELKRIEAVENNNKIYYGNSIPKAFFHSEVRRSLSWKWGRFQVNHGLKQLTADKDAVTENEMKIHDENKDDQGRNEDDEKKELESKI